MTRAQLVVAVGAAQSAAVRGWLGAHPTGRRVILAEAGLQALDVPPDVPLIRLMAGCICCVGQVPMRVALVRLLRHERPDDLLVIIADDDHLDRVQALLQSEQFGLSFDPDVPVPVPARRD